jgi:hypothetical protein
MYYGNSGASSASNGANTFIAFEDFEWGSDGDNITTSGGSVTWTVTTGGTSTAKIDTGQKYAGTRSMQFVSDGANVCTAYFSLTASETIAIQFWYRKDTNSSTYFRHGDGSTYMSVNPYTDEKIYIDNVDSGKVVVVNTWTKFEFTDINYTANTFDLWLSDVKEVNDANQSAGATASGQLLFLENVSGGNSWIDNIIVRKWYATEPVWGAWGTPEVNGEISDIATFTDSFTGQNLSGNITDNVTLTDSLTGQNLSGNVSEVITIDDTIVGQSLAGRINETVTLTDSFVADDMVRLKWRYPNTMGKHLSFKFQSSGDDNFALLYLRLKLYKALELDSSVHPNTQGTHIGLKLQTTGDTATKMYYMSHAMRRVET